MALNAPARFEYLVYVPPADRAAGEPCQAVRCLRCSGVACRGKGATIAAAEGDLAPRCAVGQPAKPGHGSSSPLGVFLRVLEYSDNRQLYADEEDLQKNLVGFAFYDFQTPLVERQLASAGIPRRRAADDLAATAVSARSQAGSVRLLDRVDVLDEVRRATIPHRRCRSDRRRSLRTDRLDTLLFGRDQAVQQRRGAGAHWRFCWRPSTMLTSRRIVPDVAARLPRSHRVRSDRRLVLSSSGAGSGGCRKLSHSEGRLSKDWGCTIAAAGMSALWALNFAGCYWVSDRIVSQGRIPRTLVGASPFCRSRLVRSPISSESSGSRSTCSTLRQAFSLPWACFHRRSSPAGCFCSAPCRWADDGREACFC